MPLHSRKFETMNILITGGVGFIGSVIGERLIEGGHNVHVLDDFSNSYQENIPSNALLYEADITLPYKADRIVFNEAFKDIDLVIHCAAVADVEASVSDNLTE